MRGLRRRWSPAAAATFNRGFQKTRSRMGSRAARACRCGRRGDRTDETAHGKTRGERSKLTGAGPAPAGKVGAIERPFSSQSPTTGAAVGAGLSSAGRNVNAPKRTPVAPALRAPDLTSSPLHRAANASFRRAKADPRKLPDLHLFELDQGNRESAM
jgi:hypothetical protein